MKRNINITRLLGLLLALSLCIAMLPATASAAGIFSIDSNNVLTRYNSPDGTCTRGQIVTFLYRAYQQK